ncbi:MAG: hypothetical protein QW244_03390, partial [Candidatus Pacearchaeota archaeon]
LRIWKHNGTWYNTGFYNVNGVDTANNIVYANITSFSVFAPLGKSKPREEGPGPRVNHPPEIIEYKPETLTLVTKPKKTIEFYVKARDIDNDNLILRFYLDNKFVKEFNGTSLIEGSYKFKTDSINHKIVAYINDSKGAYTQVAWQIITEKEKPCIDEWNCSEWSECADGVRYRSCVKLNPECESNEHKPSERESCVVAIPEAPAPVPIKIKVNILVLLLPIVIALVAIVLIILKIIEAIKLSPLSLFKKSLG